MWNWSACGLPIKLKIKKSKYEKMSLSIFQGKIGIIG
jgi:hypothetical protein